MARATGMGLAVLSAATFGTSGAFGSLLIDAGWSPAAAVTARVTLGALILTPFALASLDGRWSLLRQGYRTIAAYGLFAVAGAQLAYFNAIAHLSVGVALLLEYLGTVLVVGWLWARHGQRPRPLTVLGGLAAVAGLVLVLNLTGAQRVDLTGVLWGFVAAIGLAFYFVLSAGAETELPPLVLAWAGLAVGAVALIGLGATGVLAVRAPLVPVTLLHHRVSWLVPVLWLAIMAAVIPYSAGIGAARRLGAKVSSFVGLSEVLFAVLFAWLVLSQVPAAIQLAGGVLIIGGVALVRLDDLRGERVRPGSVKDQSDEATGLLEHRR